MSVVVMVVKATFVFDFVIYDFKDGWDSAQTFMLICMQCVAWKRFGKKDVCTRRIFVKKIPGEMSEHL